MAVGKGKEDDLDEAYDLLGVEEEATEKEIQAAFRKGSLRVHPDRNPDDPQAAEKFDQLTRAKDLLLDPARRAEFDRKRQAKRDLEERFEREDDKRKKMRQDLEGREAAAASKPVRRADEPSPEELRKRAAQLDYAARLKARQAEVAGKQNEVIAEVVQTRAAAEEARLLITWRSGSPSLDTIRKALQEFGVLQIESSDTGAVAQFGSREDALRAVLECRQRKHQLPFRAALAGTKKAQASGPEFASGPEVEKEAKPQTKPQAKQQAQKVASSGFDDWEAKMFASLQGLAKQQKASSA